MADVFAGDLLLPDDVVQGWVAIEGGRIVDWDEGDDLPEPPVAQGWIVPGLVNAHTHVADAFLRDVEGKPTSIPELVGPGGWKHKHLAMARRGRVGRGVIRYAAEMSAVGVGHFIDFRENGTTGVRFLRELVTGADWTQAEGLEAPAAQPVIMGRPKLYDFDADEAEEILSQADGIALSGLRDFPDRRDVEAWANAAHRAGKPFAMHLSEDVHEDVEAALALDPDFLVHLCHAPRSDLRALAEAEVPVVVCPRSNQFFGHRPPVEAMLDTGCLLAVGTDNGMLQDGDLLAELRLLKNWIPDLDDADLLRMATYGGRELLGLDDALPPRKGAAADLVVLPKDVLRPAGRKPQLSFAPPANQDGS